MAAGTPHEVLTEDTLREVFDLDAQIMLEPVASTPLVIPIRRRAREELART